jgi:hypothetical protein
MGHSFLRTVAALGALALAGEVAHGENGGDGAIDKANRSIDNTRDRVKRALGDSANKINNDIVNTRNNTKRAFRNTDTKVNNEVVRAQHKVKGAARDTGDKTNHR